MEGSPSVVRRAREPRSASSFHPWSGMPDALFEIAGSSPRDAARLPLATLWLAASLAMSGCLFQKPPPRAFVPPPVKPRAVVQEPVRWGEAAPGLEANLTPDQVPAPLWLTASIAPLLPAPPRAAPPARRTGPVVT